MSKSIKNLSELTVEELTARRRELKEESLMLRVQKEAGQLENPARLRTLRREVARIETVLSVRRVGQA